MRTDTGILEKVLLHPGVNEELRDTALLHGGLQSADAKIPLIRPVVGKSMRSQPGEVSIS